MMRDFTEEERIGAVAPLAGRTRWSRAEGVLLIAAGVGVLADSFAHLAPAGIVAAAGFGFAGLSGLLLTVTADGLSPGHRSWFAVIGAGQLAVAVLVALVLADTGTWQAVALGAALIVIGAVRFLLGLTGRPGWSWLVISALVTMGLGAAIYVSPPEATWSRLATLLAVELIASGAAAVMGAGPRRQARGDRLRMRMERER